MAATHDERPRRANSATKARFNRRRSTTRPSTLNPTRLQTFFPGSVQAPQFPLASSSSQNDQSSYPVVRRSAGHAIIEANRRNALRSTGPRSDSGRAVSSCNALKHGLTAERIILFDEQREAFERFYAELIAALKPDGPRETQLAQRIAINAWRLRRAYRVEGGLFARLARYGAKVGPSRPRISISCS
jgi:hypothetical protein